jgi:hypothetical protein
VHFTIGTYLDFFDCDVVPMQACSLFLSRPCQFDRESIHNGKSNLYSLVHARKKIGLKPLTPEQILKDDFARATRLKNGGKIRVSIRLLLQILYHPNILLNLILTMLSKFV